MEERFMARALELARRGEGRVSPNPMVGAVIVRDGRIIGEGWHKVYGGNHAEVEAFLKAEEDVEGADLYVTLEPCSHYGKTPPCAQAVVDHKIKRVTVCLKDPNPLVSGNGIRLLRENGIQVEVGMLEEEGRRLNEVFLKYITTGKPFCLMKTAMTLDGKIASRTGDARWISCEESRNYVHRLRRRFSGIMVGIGTVLADDPQLTCRLEGEDGRNPVRIIVDSTARIPLDAQVLQDGQARTIIAATEKAQPEKLAALQDTGAQVLILPDKRGKVDLSALMTELGKEKIDGVLLEGGGSLNYAMLEEGLVDAVNTFIAPKLLGGAEAFTPVEGVGLERVGQAFEVSNLQMRQIGRDFLLEGYLNGEGKQCLQD